jgi:diguanylate cyclase (GGDEF)-like protein
MTPRTPRLVIAIVTLIAVLVAGAWSVRGGIAGFIPARLLIGVGVVALAQWARIRVRVGGGNARLAWGEAALVVLCAIEPAAAVPVTVAAGVALAQATLQVRGPRRPAWLLLYNVSALTVAGGLAALTVTRISSTYGVAVTPRVVLALCAGGVVYGGVGSLLITAVVVATHGGKPGATFVDLISSKLLMVIGNVLVGLVVVWLLHDHTPFLLLLPPVFWLLQQLYSSRLRDDDDRRTWQLFAEATRELNQLDVHGVVAAGAQGLRRLFPLFDAAEVVVGPAPDLVGGWTIRPLVVGGARIGELRLHGGDPLRSRDRMVLAAYGDALAAALHDAVTHDELRSMSERTTYDAVHDPLTGLNNRAALLVRGNAALHRLATHEPAALLLLDINHFKEVNNALGHTAGDELLQVIAHRVAETAGPDDLLARLGGDEFALLVTDLAAEGVDLALAAAVERARKLAAQLAVPTQVAGVLLSVEASVGVVVAPAGGIDMTELLRRADIAMYQAKRAVQAVAWYDAMRDDASTDRLGLLADLREALAADDQIVVDLQPAVSLAPGSGHGQITGMEALVRWQHPRRGLLAPGDFLPTVEHSELIGPLTMRVLERAVHHAAGWRSAGLGVPVSVNLSPRSLLDRRLPGQIHALLRRHRLPAELLVLEITESVVMSDLPVTDEVLASLREIGVQLAVDDFGTGYSSLTFLTRVPVDEVKIDRAFVARMVDSPEAAAIVRTTVELALSLGVRVVAEGVETAEQKALLSQLGCTSAQGYHFYRPLSPDKITEILRKGRQQKRRHLRAEGTG